MQRNQQTRLSSLLRVQDFLDTHASDVTALATSGARKQLDTAIATLEGLSTDQGLADRTMAGLVSKQRALTTALKQEHVTPISTFARARLRGVPEYAALTRSCKLLEGLALVRAARAVTAAAKPHASELADGGFPPDTIAQLEACVDALEASLETRFNMKVGRVKVTSSIKEQVKAGREAVAMLHAAVSRHFVNDKASRDGWNAARRVQAKPGKAREAVSPSAPTPLPTPATKPVTPAAAVA